MVLAVHDKPAGPGNGRPARGRAPYTCKSKIDPRQSAVAPQRSGERVLAAEDKEVFALVIPFALIRVVAYGVAAIIATLILGTISSRLLRFDEPSTVLLFGLVIGAINAFIKPIVRVLTLPITCLTFGLFAVVVNTVLFYFGASLTPGMDVGWWGAIFGSILTSLASGLMFSVVDE